MYMCTFFLQAKAQVKQQIAEDRKRRSERSANPLPSPTEPRPSVATASKTTNCRVQVFPSLYSFLLSNDCCVIGASAQWEGVAQ